MKITIAREALQDIDNNSIKQFLTKNPRNRIFRLDTGSKDPSVFGIRPSSYREERITDKGYLALPYSEYNTPTYPKSDILKLFENFPDISIPNRTSISVILPMDANSDNITPAEFTTMVELYNQKKAELDSKLKTHERNEKELESQESQLDAREKEIESKLQELREGFTELDLKKSDLATNQQQLKEQEQIINAKSQSLIENKKASEALRDQVQQDTVTLENSKADSARSTNTVTNKSSDQKGTEIDQAKITEIPTRPPQPNLYPDLGTPASGTTSVPVGQQPGSTRISNPNQTLDPGRTLDQTLDLDALIAKHYAERGGPGNNVSSNSFTRNDNQNTSPGQIIQTSEQINMPVDPGSIRHERSCAFNEKIPIPLLNEETIKNLDNFLEALEALKVYYKSEATLILSILVKSKRLQIIPLLSKSERENVSDFSRFLRRFFNSNDYYSLRIKYENLKQSDDENVAVYLRRVMRLYYLSKSLDPPGELRDVHNEAIQKDICFKFMMSLRDQKLRHELTIRDPSWSELPELSTKLEDIYKRLKSESVSVIQSDLEASVNKITDGCFNCGSRSHIARECRASRKDKRSFNRKERRRSFSRGRSRDRQEFRKSPFPSRNASYNRSSSRDRDKYYRSKSRSQSGQRSSRSPYRRWNRSQSSPRRRDYDNRSYSRWSSPNRNRTDRSNSRDRFENRPRSPRRSDSKDRYDRKVKFAEN